MKEYEITYLANPKLEEAQKNELDNTITERITKAGGEISYISSSDTLGSRRRLHYPINNNRVAWLGVIQTQLDPGKVKALRTNLKKIPDIIRSYIVQTSRREDTSETILQNLSQQSTKEKPTPSEKKPLRPVTMKEVEEKIEEALEEEVK